MAVDLPTVVIEADAPRTPQGLSVLGPALGALRSWEQHAQVHAVALPVDPAPRPLSLDPAHSARVASIEGALHAARATLDLGEPSTVDSVRARLAAAYDDARAHPQDAEAPWLVAEALRLSARAEALAGDPIAAAVLRARARLLDGGRALGLSEGIDAVPGAQAIDATVTLDGAPPGTLARIDGEPHDATKPFVARLAPGEHHLRVTLTDPDGLDRGVLLARWVTVVDADSAIRARVADGPVACSARDLGPALEAAARNATFEVRCPRWAIARRVGPATLDVRTCDARSCAASETWLGLASGKPPAARTDGGAVHGPWRSGWTYVAIGAATLAVGGLAAWRLGAFDRPQSPPPTWRWEGIR